MSEAHPSAIRILGFCNFKKSIYKIPSFSSLQERQEWDVEVALALGSGLKSIDSFRLYELSTKINKSLNQYYNVLIILLIFKFFLRLLTCYALNADLLHSFTAVWPAAALRNVDENSFLSRVSLVPTWRTIISRKLQSFLRQR